MPLQAFAPKSADGSENLHKQFRLQNREEFLAQGPSKLRQGDYLLEAEGVPCNHVNDLFDRFIDVIF